MLYSHAMTDEQFMEKALRLAEQGAEAGEVPVGAVIVKDGRILGRAHNQVEALHDATAHAEMIVITQAAAALAGRPRSGGGFPHLRP